MKITFLGTAAAEGIPSPFCNCAICKNARLNKGYDVRKRSSILINDDLIIDLGPDLMVACSDVGVSLNQLKYALVTHAHFDHFYPHNLEIRFGRYQKNEPLCRLKLVAGPSVLQQLQQIKYKDEEIEIERVPIMPFQQIALSPYIINSIKATHALEFGDAMNYIIDDGENKILYATDTGLYDECVLEKISGNIFRVIILDATNGLGYTSNNHLNFERFNIMVENFKTNNNLSSNTIICATHFSHSSLLPHEELQALLNANNICCAFDGQVVSI